MSKATKVIALCKDYNGFKNVLFMMKSDDFRLAEVDSKYTVVAQAKHDSKTKTVIADGVTYRVFSDWSVKAA